MKERSKYPEPIVGLYVVHGKEIAVVKSPKWKGWRVAGGHVEYGEDILDAAKREAKEELGIDVTPVGMLDIAQSIRPGDLNGKPRHFIFFEILCKAKSRNLSIDGVEITDYKWVPFEEAERLFESSISKQVIRKYRKSKKIKLIAIL